MATLLTPAQSIAKASGVTDPLMTNEEYIAKAQNYLIQNSTTVTPTETVLQTPEQAIQQAQTWPPDDQIRYRAVEAPPPKANLPTYKELQSTVAETLRLANLDNETKVLYIENGYNIPPPINAPNSGYKAGAPSTASLARGIVFGTIKDTNNNRRAHVCNFIDEMRKNEYLQKFIKASAQYIREGIRAVLKVLGLSDTSGAFAAVAAKLKEAVRWLKTVQKYLKDIINFEKYVIRYIAKIKAIIQWIMGLPARLIKLLSQCLAKFLRLVKNVMTDFFKLVTEGDGNSGFGDAISSATEFVNESIKTVNLAATAATGAVAVAGAAASVFTTITSTKDLSKANKAILSYAATLPDGKYVAPTQKKKTP